MNQNETSHANHHELEHWLTNYIAKRCDIPASELDANIPFEEFGIDSVQAVEITVEIEHRFYIPIEPTALFEFNTISLLVSHVLSRATSASAQ